MNFKKRRGLSDGAQTGGRPSSFWLIIREDLTFGGVDDIIDIISIIDL